MSKRKQHTTKTRQAGNCTKCGQQANHSCLLYVCAACAKLFCSSHIATDDKCDECLERGK